MDLQAELEVVKREQQSMESSSLAERQEGQQVREGKQRALDVELSLNSLVTGPA